MALHIEKISCLNELVKNVWLIMAAIGGVIYWAAKHDTALNDIGENRARITTMENRMATLENGLNKLQVKIDDIKEDLTLIKSAVIK